VTGMSERIRSLIVEPMTATEIHSKMPDVSLPLIRGLIQTMLARGLAHRIGDKRPYRYKVGRGLEIHNRGRDLNVTAQVRDCIKKSGPISPDRIAMETGIAIREVRARITEMKKRKFIQADENGCLVFLRDRITPTTRMADSERRQRDRVRMKLARQKAAQNRPVQSTPMTVVNLKGKPEPKNVVAQTVDEWLKAGGIIDRSPTPVPFERLTIEDIAPHDYRARPNVGQRASRSYLAG
jgi:hypothetical protein